MNLIYYYNNEIKVKKKKTFNLNKLSNFIFKKKKEILIKIVF